MLAFVDASGDPGRRIANRSSRFFIVALVTLDEQDASECDRRVTGLRATLGLPSDFEFHFSDNSARIRQEFLKVIAPCHFWYHLYAIDKSRYVVGKLDLEPGEDLLSYVVRQTCLSATEYLENAKVVLDGEKGNRRFKNELATSLRRGVKDSHGRGMVRSVRMERSRANSLLQLADYVAGVHNRVLCGRPDGAELYRYLAGHELTSHVWPQI